MVQLGSIATDECARLHCGCIVKILVQFPDKSETMVSFVQQCDKPFLDSGLPVDECCWFFEKERGAAVLGLNDRTNASYDALLSMTLASFGEQGGESRKQRRRRMRGYMSAQWQRSTAILNKLLP